MTLSDDIARRRALAEAATPGPWETFRDDRGEGLFPRWIVQTTARSEYGLAEAWITDLRIATDEGERHDAAFLAAHHPGIVKALWDVAEAAKKQQHEGWCRAINHVDCCGHTDEDCDCSRKPVLDALDALAAAMREEQS